MKDHPSAGTEMDCQHTLSNQQTTARFEAVLEPPVPVLIYHSTPVLQPSAEYGSPIYRRRWRCPAQLVERSWQATMSRGLGKVLDMDRYYLMVTETLTCTVFYELSTSQTVLDQLDLLHQKLLSLILTRMWVKQIFIVWKCNNKTN